MQTQKDSRKLVGGRFLKYDVTDWPLVVMWLPPIPNKEDPTDADMQDATQSLHQVMHVAKHGSDGNAGMPDFDVGCMSDDERAWVYPLPETLTNLTCGPVIKILDLTDAYLPSWKMVPAIVKLVQDSERLQKGCSTERYVVVPERLCQLVNTVVGAIGHVTARFVSSLDEAYAEISKQFD